MSWEGIKSMLNNILNTIARAAAIYVLALFLTRLMGRKLISQMTFFDFIVGVSIGSLAANAMIGSGRTPSSTVSALIVISFLDIAASYLHIKSFKGRKLIDSEPVTLVDNGTIVEDNMRKIRLTVNELMMMLREKNAFNLADVEFAIMETDGQMSVLPKADKKPLTPSHMNIKTTSTGLTRDLIIDGNLMTENLKAAGLDENWLNSQLKTQNIKHISEVFYAGMDNSKNLYISKKNAGGKESHGKYGLE
jgi:uncharacterized membrane protein YcaP (DUF421 family)